MKALRYENQKLAVSDVPPPRVDGEALVAGAGGRGDRVFDDQLSVEAAGGRAAEYLGKHVERFGDAFVGGRIGGRQISAHHRGLAHTGVRQADAARD